MQEEEDYLKVVLNVRDSKHISLLKQIKKEAGINYQNLIKLGVLFLLKERALEANKAQQELQKPPTASAVDPAVTPPVPTPKVNVGGVPVKEEVLKEEPEDDLIKVHITYHGRIKGAIEALKPVQTPQDTSRKGLQRVYEFFTGENPEESPFTEETLINYIDEIKQNKSLFDFLDKKIK